MILKNGSPNGSSDDCLRFCPRDGGLCGRGGGTLATREALGGGGSGGGTDDCCG